MARLKQEYSAIYRLTPPPTHPPIPKWTSDGGKPPRGQMKELWGTTTQGTRMWEG